MKNNPQYLRTDKAIRQALISLLKKKPFEKITVQDILDETPVTRSTFYKHYHDKYDIVEQMQDDFLNTLAELSREAHENPNHALLSQSNLIHEQKEVLLPLLNVHTEKVNLHEVFAKFSELHYLNHSNNPDKELQAKVYAHMITAFTLYEHDLQLASLEYMHDTIISVAFFALGLSEEDELRDVLKAKASSRNSPYK